MSTLVEHIETWLWSKWWKHFVYFRRFPEEKPGYGVRNFVAKLFGRVESMAAKPRKDEKRGNSKIEF